MTTLISILIVLVTAGVAAVALLAIGGWRWRRASGTLVRTLEATATPVEKSRYDKSEISMLPSVVQRYFGTALRDGAPIVTGAWVRHRGSFNLSATGEKWRAFTSEQRVITLPRGFVWNASISVLPGLPVHVHDALISGEGRLHPSVGGLVSMMDLRGGGDLALGELMRFFAEAAWYPTALLPSQGVNWTPIDDRSARATIHEGPLTLAMTFTFRSDGLMESMRVEDRCRLIGGKSIATPWEGRWSNYGERHGMRIPLTGEVAWLTPEGRRPYWRGTITDLRYEFSR